MAKNMEYVCECGCGEMVEKTIFKTDACRKRIARGSVRKLDGSSMNVLIPDKNVLGKRTDVQKEDKPSFAAKSDEIVVVSDGCTECGGNNLKKNPFTGKLQCVDCIS